MTTTHADSPVAPAPSTSSAPVRREPGRVRLVAWGVHALTMSGLIFASLAMLAVIHEEIRWMWLWLAIAMVIDGVDGTCARRARVKEVIPWFDGSVLDIIVDYLTWTFIPAIFMYQWLPMGPKPLAGALMILILASSIFCYANEGEKSTDNYFVGFPAAWNIAAVMMWTLGTPAVVNIVATLALAVLTLVPSHYVHPARVKRFRSLNLAAVGVWLAGTAWLVIAQPQRPLAAAVMSVGAGVWLLVVGVIRTAHGEDDE